MRTQWDEKVAKALKKKTKRQSTRLRSEDKGETQLVGGTSGVHGNKPLPGSALSREVIPMDKEILKQYIDACEQVKEAKEDILRLKKNRKKIVQDRVSDRRMSFRIPPRVSTSRGLSYPVVKDPDELDRREAILQERLQKAEEISARWSMDAHNSAEDAADHPVSNFEELPWGEVAIKMGRRATADSVRMEYLRFMGEK